MGVAMDNFALMVAVAALAVGLILGLIIGRWTKARSLAKDTLRDEALRELAQFDFEKVRDKAHEIVRLGNEIAQYVTTAHDMVLPLHVDIEERPSLPDAPGMQGFKKSNT
jgi:hypothetical protein